MSAVYLITPVGTATISEDLKNRIKQEIPNSNDRFFLPQDNGCLVKFDGIGLELRDRLILTGSKFLKENFPEVVKERNLTDDIPSIPALITTVVPGGYNGFALSQLWEWLNLKLA